MASLIRTNPYLKSPEMRERMLIRSIYQSSVMEGARCLRVGRPVRTSRSKPSAKRGASKS